MGAEREGVRMSHSVWINSTQLNIPGLSFKNQLLQVNGFNRHCLFQTTVSQQALTLQSDT